MSKNNGSGSKPWGQPREIPVSEIQSRSIRGKWDDLRDDILLRLEKTGQGRALEYSFENEAEGRYAVAAMRKMFENSAVVISSCKLKDGGRLLYAQRGPNWK